MARKKETDYFEAFVGGVNSACAAADMLCTVFDHYEPEALPGHIEAMHKIEHSADIAKHGTMEQLVREFLPPIDREDIMELSGTIDDVTDSIEDVLLRLYMFNIRTLRPEAQAFAQVIADCCAALKTMMEEFPNFRRSKTIHTQIVEINGLEEQGDKLYRRHAHAVRGCQHARGRDGLDGAVRPPGKMLRQMRGCGRCCGARHPEKQLRLQLYDKRKGPVRFSTALYFFIRSLIEPLKKH